MCRRCAPARCRANGPPSRRSSCPAPTSPPTNCDRSTSRSTARGAELETPRQRCQGAHRRTCSRCSTASRSGCRASSECGGLLILSTTDEGRSSSSSRSRALAPNSARSWRPSKSATRGASTSSSTATLASCRSSSSTPDPHRSTAPRCATTSRTLLPPGQACDKAVARRVCPYAFWGLHRSIARTVQWHKDRKKAAQPWTTTISASSVLYGATVIADDGAPEPLPTAERARSRAEPVCKGHPGDELDAWRKAVKTRQHRTFWSFSATCRRRRHQPLHRQEIRARPSRTSRRPCCAPTAPPSACAPHRLRVRRDRAIRSGHCQAR